MPSKPLRTLLVDAEDALQVHAALERRLDRLSWMLRFCATAAMPAVRQPASPTSTNSTGVAPLSGDAKTSG